MTLLCSPAQHVFAATSTQPTFEEVQPPPTQFLDDDSEYAGYVEFTKLAGKFEQGSTGVGTFALVDNWLDKMFWPEKGCYVQRLMETNPSFYAKKNYYWKPSGVSKGIMRKQIYCLTKK